MLGFYLSYLLSVLLFGREIVVYVWRSGGGGNFSTAFHSLGQSLTSSVSTNYCMHHSIKIIE